MINTSSIKNVTNIIFFSIIVYLLYDLIDYDLLKETIYQFNFSHLLIISALFLLRPLMKTYRWFIIIKNFSKIKFIDFFRNTILGLSIDVFTSSPIALEITRVIKIKKEIGFKQSLILILFDRIYTLTFRIISLGIIVVAYSFFYIKQIFFEVLLILIFLTLLIFFLNYNFKKIVNLSIFRKYIKHDIKEILNIFYKTKKKFFQLFLINFIILFVNITLYYLIFKSLNKDTNFFDLSIFISIVDFITQFQFIVFGLKEFTTVYFSNFININHEVALVGALVHRVLDSFNIVFLYGIFNLFTFKNKKKLS